ncbi:MAG: 4Fe-4S cluster-binding domain-containing protein [Spirochaetales bacterium]|nr:4Fe-4S cluster-binding domain-containing protein [Spirochaetales bacterium]
MIFQLSEYYLSLSGEAPAPGCPVAIFRFSGCNLQCRDCDTPEREDVNFRLSAEELGRIIDRELLNYPGLSVLLTGGEPLLPQRKKALKELMAVRPDTTFYVETNGSQLIPSGPDNAVYVIDYKAPSQEEVLFQWENLALMRSQDCLKMPLCQEDLDWALIAIRKLKEARPDVKIFLSPIWGKLEPKDLASFILKNKLPVSLSLQIHKVIWGPRIRGV